MSVTDIHSLLEHGWQAYLDLNPQARIVRALFEDRSP